MFSICFGIIFHTYNLDGCVCEIIIKDGKEPSIIYVFYWAIQSESTLYCTILCICFVFISKYYVNLDTIISNEGNLEFEIICFIFFLYKMNTIKIFLWTFPLNFSLQVIYKTLGFHSPIRSHVVSYINRGFVIINY